MKKQSSKQTKKLNLMLSNGLYAISAKVREGCPLVPVFLTDFAVSLRLVLDSENGKVLANRYGVEVSEKDAKAIVAALGLLDKKEEEKKQVAEAGKKLEEAKAALDGVKVGVEKTKSTREVYPGIYVEVKF